MGERKRGGGASSALGMRDTVEALEKEGTSLQGSCGF